MNNVLGYEIKEKYSSELSEISSKLEQIENGRIYGLNHNISSMDGCLATNVRQLREMLNDLLSKIQYGKDSADEKLAKQLFG